MLHPPAAEAPHAQLRPLHVGQDALDHRIGFRVHGRGIQRFVAVGGNTAWERALAGYGSPDEAAVLLMPAELPRAVSRRSSTR